MRRISFIIPCYCSEKTIEDVIDEIERRVIELPFEEYEIITINDCSPDRLYEVLKKRALVDHCIKVISLSKNFGQHSAIMAGLNYCRGDVVVYLDDDGQCPLDRLQDLLNPLFAGYDVSVAEYPQKKQSIIKNIGSSLNEYLLAWLTDKPNEIQISNFMALKKELINIIREYKGPYPSLGSMVFRSTSSVISVPMLERERVCGSTTYTLKKLIGLLFSNLLGFTIKPLRVAISIGACFSLMGILYAIILIIKKMINPMIVMGYSSIMVAILVVGGINLLFMGVVGEYVGRIFMTQNGTPQYCVKDTINIKKDCEIDDEYS